MIQSPGTGCESLHTPGDRAVVLAVEHLQGGYDHLQVLWDVSLQVMKGELVALLGRNGAGKTTALKTVAGLLKPKAGRITFLGHPIENLAAHEISRRKISLVPESLCLFAGMPVSENLLLGAYCVRDQKAVREAMEYVFQLFPILAQRRKQVAGTLSGGEQRMLALARGLMSRPQLLLVDELSLGLAPRTALTVFEALLKLKEQAITILLVEQNVHTTLQISDRTYVLEQGCIVLEGASKQLMDNEHVCSTYLGSGD
jgi:branched-chain amino acid transport system ATP-binding protein